MTVSELRELLAHLDGNMPVLFAGQPAWPMEYDLRYDVIESEGAVYLTEGSQLGYLRAGVSELIGWRE
ncbi:hypothetical protein C5C56_06090 [Rathayibacter sp. AY1D1]|uniref:hypothetical protein n=1 Tax=Rathayibacter sp. AY1D1 TaxID=2080542 RepID=UPI000CE89B72|nr:hypothetical protein [Rathayibacter sp. AY1D1]PPI00607.1 hypothetical protein C5C56_06090 [Rathayibacter sp. AY1D1]